MDILNDSNDAFVTIDSMMAELQRLKDGMIPGNSAIGFPIFDATGKEVSIRRISSASRVLVSKTDFDNDARDCSIVLKRGVNLVAFR